MPKSNTYGRALEYAIAKRIVDTLSADRLVVTETTIVAQERDKAKLEEMTSDLRKEYQEYASIIFDWLDEQYNISKTNVVLDRLSDQDAVKGDVTDIRLDIGGRQVNLSIKHNHAALKHQRPPTVAMQCGYPKGSKEDVNYRAAYSGIINKFLNAAEDFLPGVIEFNQLKSKQSDFIDKLLYKPVCLLVVKTINKLCTTNSDGAKILFKFLVGNTDFYKLKAEKGNVELQEFMAIPIPSKVTATTYKNSYVKLVFSNDWEILMRLHTAASALGSDIKFDTQLVNGPVPLKTIIKKVT